MDAKIFGCGLPLTGQVSLSRALAQLGFPVTHDPVDPGSWDRSPSRPLSPDFVRGYPVVTGLPPRYLPMLHEAYPEARFILTIQSREHWMARWSEQQPKLLAPLKTLGRNPVPCSLIEFLGVTEKTDPEKILDIYKSNYVTAIQNMPNDPRLLVLNLHAGDRWDVLLKFLANGNAGTVEHPKRFPIAAGDL